MLDFSSKKCSGSTGPVERLTVKMPIVRLELVTQDYKPSPLAIELYSSKAFAEKDLSLSSWCITPLHTLYQVAVLHHYILIISQLLYTSKAIAVKELNLIQLEYCIIMYLSFLNCD